MAILIRGIDMPNSLEAKCYYIFGKTGKVSYQDKIVGDAIQVDEEDYKRPVGKWIRWHEIVETKTCTDYIPHCKCSECNTEYDPHSAKFVKFCYECGARMEEEDG